MGSSAAPGSVGESDEESATAGASADVVPVAGGPDWAGLSAGGLLQPAKDSAIVRQEQEMSFMTDTSPQQGKCG